MNKKEIKDNEGQKEDKKNKRKTKKNFLKG